MISGAIISVIDINLDVCLLYEPKTRKTFLVSCERIVLLSIGGSILMEHI